MKRGLIFASLVLGTATAYTVSAAARSPIADGAPLYLAERGTSKVYVFGACGAQSKGWLSDRIRNALSESSDLWRELPTESMTRASIAYSDRLGSLPHGTLLDILTKEDTDRVLDAAQKLGIDRQRLATMQIWYAARILTFASYAKGGTPVLQANDPELLLSRMAAEQGKPIRPEVRNWNEFSDFFARMSERVQKEYMDYSLDDIEKGPREAEAGDLACGRGDPSYFEKSVIDFSRRYPELYKYLNGDRDVEWARRIIKMLAAGGTHFIVVGINHTVGPRSIQNELRKVEIATHRM